MADPKQYAYADLGTLTLEVGEETYDVAQFNAAFALNEVPTAQCLIAVGRDAASGSAATPAAVHKAHSLKQMTPAKVRFTPTGEYRPDGTRWPDGPQVIFSGYFTGFAPRKVNGKFFVVAPLIHWLVDLSCSSAVCQGLHAANPTQLNAVAAVLSSLDDSGAAQGSTIGALAAAEVVAPAIGADFWKAIKSLFCALANVPVQAVGPGDACGGDGDFRTNDRALKALALFEGDAEGCPFDPVDLGPNYSVPLAIANGGVSKVDEALAAAIGDELVESYASTSFWGKLVGQFCPLFQLAVVPMVARALVVADTPAYRGGPWKTLALSEYSDADFTPLLERPLRGVGVVASWSSPTQAGVGPPGALTALRGGCWIEDSVDPGDGLLQFVPEPAWLRLADLVAAPDPPDVPGRAAGADAVGADAGGGGEGAGAGEDEGGPGNAVDALYRDYAHSVYVMNTLRGRHGTVSGKLRFDIAPGSIVRVVGDAEEFLGGADALAIDYVGCVQRVTITINAESGVAATSFQLSHVRSASENAEPRTSVAAHPLFGAAIHGGGKHGAPLIPAYDL